MDPFDNKLLDEIAEGERWLAGHAPPAVSDETLDRIRRAARAELARTHPCVRGWAAWQGAAASAAAILLAVTVGWFSTQTPTAPAWDLGDLAFAEENGSSIETFDAIDADVASLETVDEDDRWAVSGAALYDALDSALSESASGDLNNTGAMRPHAGRMDRIEEA